jgi:two-component system chemotaxis response regulator CheY
MAKILICDDALFMRAALQKIVEEAGHEVVGSVCDGISCVNAYKEMSPDIVLMDITIPLLNGVMATKQIVKYDSNAKVIMVSALGSDIKISQAIDAGAVDFVAKPFEANQLIECINKYI